MNSDSGFLPAPYWALDDAVGEYAVIITGAALAASAMERIEVLLAAATIVCRPAPQPPTPGGIELLIETSGPQAFEIFNTLYRQYADVDVFVVPQETRKKALLICDMDSTIIQTESLDELADYMGIGEQIAAITRRAMNGEIEFRDALAERVALLTGLSYASVDDCVKRTRYNDGARELVAAARAEGVRTVLVSGGFSPFVSYVAEDLGFDHWVANTLEIRDYALTGRVVPPIVDKDTKLEVLHKECASLGIATTAACTIGDGANDIDMLVASGLGIAYRAKKIVHEAVPYHLRYTSLATAGTVMGLSNAC